ncbi:Tetratricopeptide repeat-containing protein [Singulisphaera sp. GP187]|uniref:tetratricopeptide repeat protein n=1 Tax=Singulisphaera sp. GP187 TaxID=1882752 RepID=UPI000928B025|nr:tetratricopeptide repeat protein [Singulisphaera sp. GP187]SIO36789.1 Tetratricopeptide repeat-containing protein [Singulisphaera sp. GP187]
MKLPDGRLLVVDDGVLAEAAAGDGRLVLWLPGARAGGFRHWDRVGSAAGATVSSSDGIGSIAAVLTPTRQRTRIGVPRFLRRLVGGKAEPIWTLPGGGICERSGARRTDLVLAWPEDETGTLELDEARIRARWPATQAIRRIGRNLSLVSGIAPAPVQTPSSSAVAAVTDLPPLIPTRELAAHALAEARQAGDHPREVTALIDLAVSYLHKLDAQPAASLLEDALNGARRLGDRTRELDAQVNLAQAAIMQGRPDLAIELLGPALAYAREIGDRFTEKVALERLGLAYQGRADHSQALDQFEQALALARSMGDTQHEAVLLWYAGIADAELGRPDRALARGEETVALLRRLRKPQAEEYAQHLADYRSSIAAVAPALKGGGVFDASVITTYSQLPSQGSTAAGPGLLRMALTATKAAVAFAGSGFKTVPLEIYRARLATCSQCEMFTGVRCRVCGCISAAKARLPHEDCPAGKWSS